MNTREIRFTGWKFSAHICMPHSDWRCNAHTPLGDWVVFYARRQRPRIALLLPSAEASNAFDVPQTDPHCYTTTTVTTQVHLVKGMMQVCQCHSLALLLTLLQRAFTKYNPSKIFTDKNLKLPLTSVRPILLFDVSADGRGHSMPCFGRARLLPICSSRHVIQN